MFQLHKRGLYCYFRMENRVRIKNMSCNLKSNVKDCIACIIAGLLKMLAGRENEGGGFSKCNFCLT